MATALRRTGIGVVGDMPWGTHFCHFYETKDDLLETVVPYFKAGLEDYEFCMWVVPSPSRRTRRGARCDMSCRDLDRYVADRSIEMFRAREWYLKGGKFDLGRVTAAWNSKLEGALARGYAGMRVSGNSAWLDKKDWRDFCEYEEQLNGSIAGQPMTVLCTYPLADERRDRAPGRGADAPVRDCQAPGELGSRRDAAAPAGQGGDREAERGARAAGHGADRGSSKPPMTS